MNERLLNIIRDEYQSLSKSHRLLADIFLNEEINDNCTLIELSKLAYCSHSTTLRFINILGYSSFKVFMNDLFTGYINSNNINIYESFNLVNNFIDQNKQAVNNFIANIKKAHKVYVFAGGMSKVPALNFTYKSNLCERKYFLITGLEEQNIKKGDLVIFISNSGNSKKLKITSKSIDNYYLITNKANSFLSQKAQYTYNLNNNLESKHNFDMHPKESIYSLIFFMDYIFEKLYTKKY